MKAHALLAVLALSACAAAPAPQAPTILHYLRSNQDGGLPENVWVYRPDATHVEVYKSVERCGNAAFVTATFDPATLQATQLIGGRVAEDGSQEQFAWLDVRDGAIHARIPATSLEQTIPLGGANWFLYDFDLADLNARMASKPAPRANFALWAALAWPEDGVRDLFRPLGDINASFVGDDVRFGQPALRYEVRGALHGTIWLDADEGHVMEARFAQPNHPGYANYRLTLEGVSHGGEAEWRDRLRSHWADCEAPY
jgi:hypothetical protein